jgi:hypothetical protein
VEENGLVFFRILDDGHNITDPFSFHLNGQFNLLAGGCPDGGPTLVVVLPLQFA